VSDSLDMLLMVHDKTQALATALIDHCVKAEQSHLQQQGSLGPEADGEEGAEGSDPAAAQQSSSSSAAARKASAAGSPHAPSRSQDALSTYVKTLVGAAVGLPVSCVHPSEATGDPHVSVVLDVRACAATVRGALHRAARVVPGEGGVAAADAADRGAAVRVGGGGAHESGEEAQGAAQAQQGRRRQQQGRMEAARAQDREGSCAGLVPRRRLP
jgi:hypothetical protein